MSAWYCFRKSVSLEKMTSRVCINAVEQLKNMRGIRTARTPAIVKPRQELKDADVRQPSSKHKMNAEFPRLDGSPAINEHPKTNRLVSQSLKELESSSVSPLDQIPEFPSDYENFNTRLRDKNWFRDQSRHSFRPKVNPQDTALLLFPGQGSQFVGMGKNLLEYPNVEKMYHFAGKILGYDLLDICLNGPKSTLDKTIYCQPAVLVTSLAAVEKLKNQSPWSIENCISAAGYSVGEFAALVFAGSISFEDAVRLVKVRSEAMQKASEEVPSGMMTVFFRSDAKVPYACHAARLYCSKELQLPEPVCEVSNYLYPGCKVIAGNIQALDFIVQNAGEFGIKRIQRLPVSGAFHTPLMLPAKKRFLSVLSGVEFQYPVIPVHSNVNSFKYGSPKGISKLLTEQLHKPVKWEQTMHVIYSRPEGEDFPKTFEVGPGKQLGSILKMINAKAFANYKNIEC